MPIFVARGGGFLSYIGMFYDKFDDFLVQETRSHLSQHIVFLQLIFQVIGRITQFLSPLFDGRFEFVIGNLDPLVLAYGPEDQAGLDCLFR
jgi:hypothetical protein